ncbi:DHH family phosphoesterase [Paenibacillus protaetiae]|uniref:Bifunctional oligoribonuclease/PAP phosphatase NrnA n=1 Tax=Paenibacillus protaetiae TaxID=2509456 RepID=A0A4P6ESS7_9BACL|nr:bifunctional oligoribonuclease/PAP phosphatase NrnA [Paenibacillus protaetiae]QAY65636.1 bifunctional oligoribonuclease/PAP phosphatase NrnA [Paenibacillus protaetiae]
MTAAAYLQQLDDALAFIRKHNRFFVVSHVQPDGDAISSTLAVGWLLGQLGKEAVLMNENVPPSRLSYLWGYDGIKVLEGSHADERFDAVISVDCADFSRIGKVAALFAEGAALLNIDHHPTNDGFGTVNIVKPDAAATVQILYDLIRQSGVTINLDCATCIYTGLLTDTGGFRYSNTSPQVMEIASVMLGIGVSGHWIADHMLEKMSMAKLKLLRLSLNRLEFTEDGQIGWLYIGKDDMKQTNASAEDLEGLVNYALNVEGVEAGILFKETEDGSVKASLRSAGRVDVSAIAQSFGGGGHVRAAGCRLQGPVTQAAAQLVEAVRKALI